METRYVVLRQQDSDPEGALQSWAYIVSVPATSAEAAIRSVVAEDNSGDGGTYVAIPARSFKPVTVKTETKTVVSFA